MSRAALLAQVRDVARMRSADEGEYDTDDEAPSSPAVADELHVLRSSALVSGVARASFRAALDAALARGPRQPRRRAAWRTAQPRTFLPPNDPDPAARHASSLAADLDNLVENSVVQALLEGAFRNELEDVVSRRASETMSRLVPLAAAHAQPAFTHPPQLPRERATAMLAAGAGAGSSSSELQALCQQIANLERTVAASFELQLSLQRIVQQEVAAALALSRHAHDAPPVVTTNVEAPSGAKKAPGVCILCCERDVNCALLGCGHMCYCMQCAHLAHARGQVACPMCRAPVRELLRVYPDWSEGGQTS
ncbi:hypothetical protein KFE25_001026 [Diacronema lutheri]|uniref:RING-type domain-containing protein n=1 Tax=Diacronema lutheri TaxID=2081491 RepID=A0A8J5X459_DIALT|nr:hypothetical protein KFE25_001026 [Diacronema lutheri]